MTDLPIFETLLLSRTGRRLTITFNRPDVLNAFNRVMHTELIEALRFAGRDPSSDVLVLTGAGRAFSAGGDLEQMEEIIARPEMFEAEAIHAKDLILTLLDVEKPIIARVPGPAVGLGATLALVCDIVFADETAKIGDPHVSVGLVAGDGGAIIWPQLIGFARAKEYLLTGQLLTGAEAAAIGLINHAVAAEDLDDRVDAFCAKLETGAQMAIRGTKAVINMELKRIATALLEPGLALETLSVHSDDHAQIVASLRKRKP